jgi:hypothetical protein
VTTDSFFDMVINKKNDEQPVLDQKSKGFEDIFKAAEEKPTVAASNPEGSNFWGDEIDIPSPRLLEEVDQQESVVPQEVS